MALKESLNQTEKYEQVIKHLGLIYEVVADLLRIKLFKKGIKREAIGKFDEPKVEAIVYGGVLNFHKLVFSRNAERKLQEKILQDEASKRSKMAKFPSSEKLS